MTEGDVFKSKFVKEYYGALLGEVQATLAHQDDRLSFAEVLEQTARKTRTAGSEMYISMSEQN